MGGTSNKLTVNGISRKSTLSCPIDESGSKGLYQGTPIFCFFLFFLVKSESYPVR
jgi:hypothetical protein